MAFIFFEANTDAEKRMVCGQSITTQDSMCVVTKDGSQICGHVGIRRLCRQLELGSMFLGQQLILSGFYLMFMGVVLMAGTQVLHLLCYNSFDIL